MKYLADANVLSEPTKLEPSARAIAWLGEHIEDVAVSAIVIAEIWRGIDAKVEGYKKRELTRWFHRSPRALRCLPWTGDTAIVWGGLFNQIKRDGYTVGLMDTMIAATAKLHGLTVATRNVDDFTRCGVAVVNPFE